MKLWVGDRAAGMVTVYSASRSGGGHLACGVGVWTQGGVGMMADGSLGRGDAVWVDLEVGGPIDEARVLWERALAAGAQASRRVVVHMADAGVVLLGLAVVYGAYRTFGGSAF